MGTKKRKEHLKDPGKDYPLLRTNTRWTKKGRSTKKGKTRANLCLTCSHPPSTILSLTLKEGLSCQSQPSSSSVSSSSSLSSSSQSSSSSSSSSSSVGVGHGGCVTVLDGMVLRVVGGSLVVSIDGEGLAVGVGCGVLVGRGGVGVRVGFGVRVGVGLADDDSVCFEVGTASVDFDATGDVRLVDDTGAVDLFVDTGGSTLVEDFDGVGLDVGLNEVEGLKVGPIGVGHDDTGGVRFVEEIGTGLDVGIVGLNVEERTRGRGTRVEFKDGILLLSKEKDGSGGLVDLIVDLVIDGIGGLVGRVDGIEIFREGSGSDKLLGRRVGLVNVGIGGLVGRTDGSEASNDGTLFDVIVGLIVGLVRVRGGSPFDIVILIERETEIGGRGVGRRGVGNVRPDLETPRDGIGTGIGGGLAVVNGTAGGFTEGMDSDVGGSDIGVDSLIEAEGVGKGWRPKVEAPPPNERLTAADRETERSGTPEGDKWLVFAASEDPRKPRRRSAVSNIILKGPSILYTTEVKLGSQITHFQTKTIRSVPL
ncbi:hypothetical protein P154DRAFT_534704 [Amniculicola lignicola CBS 123094]|uniref:Uncharacterized protein n=1 Tax=Amniculicola lignicola CBS 123094 TaxID=1392246 RepID=A0A6A5WFF8_9PLEO|nr:hypothetical protein P154DRAFT_534704 [Amniculicola lignicola CBS 123094]